MEVLGKEAKLVNIGLYETDGYGNYTQGDCESWKKDPSNAGMVLVVKKHECYRTPVCLYIPGRVDQCILSQYLKKLERRYTIEYYKA